MPSFVHVTAAAAACIAIGQAAASTPFVNAPGSPVSSWELDAAASDDFGGPSLGSQWLTSYDGWIGTPPGAFGNDNAIVSDGKLQLLTKYDSDFHIDAADKGCECFKDISTGLVSSATPFKYGFFEVRAKVASASVLSSFWLQGAAGELNVVDAIQSLNSGFKATNSYHCFAPAIDANAASIEAGDPASLASQLFERGVSDAVDVADGEFHVYGVDWDASRVRFYVDGELVREVAPSTSGCLDQPMHVVLSMETVKSEGIPVGDFGTLATEVSYFRHWARAPAAATTAEPATVSSTTEPPVVETTGQSGSRPTTLSPATEPPVETTTSPGSQIDKWAFIRKMARGINVGNTMDARSGEGGWRPQIQPHFFADMVQAGLSHVRIPITWTPYMSASGSVTGTWVDEADSSNTMPFLDRVEQVVGWALASGLVVVINSHHDNWLCASYDDANRARFDTLWSEIADRFKGASYDLVFEVINEPYYTKYTTEAASSSVFPADFTADNQDTVCSVAEIADLNARVVSMVRSSGGLNTERFVVVTGSSTPKQPGLYSYRIYDLIDLNKGSLATDPFVIATFHYYNSNVGAIKTHFQEVGAWSKANDIPVLVGELGQKNTVESDAWYTAAYSNAAANDFAATAWDTGVDSDTGFMVYDRSSGKDWSAKFDLVKIGYSSSTTTKEPPTTTAAAPSPSTPSSAAPSSSTPPSTSTGELEVCAGQWLKCGGKKWTGPTCCPSGWYCREQNPWYSQCTEVPAVGMVAASAQRSVDTASQSGGVGDTAVSSTGTTVGVALAAFIMATAVGAVVLQSRRRETGRPSLSGDEQRAIAMGERSSCSSQPQAEDHETWLSTVTVLDGSKLGQRGPAELTVVTVDGRQAPVLGPQPLHERRLSTTSTGSDVYAVVAEATYLRLAAASAHTFDEPEFVFDENATSFRAKSVKRGNPAFRNSMC